MIILYFFIRCTWKTLCNLFYSHSALASRDFHNGIKKCLVGGRALNINKRETCPSGNSNQWIRQWSKAVGNQSDRWVIVEHVIKYCGSSFIATSGEHMKPICRQTWLNSRKFLTPILPPSRPNIIFSTNAHRPKFNLRTHFNNNLSRDRAAVNKFD